MAEQVLSAQQTAQLIQLYPYRRLNRYKLLENYIRSSLSIIISISSFSLFVGLFVGSFLNLVADRLYTGKSFLTGRSFCDYCKHTLAWYDLFPLFSFLVLQGKCRYCKKRLSILYPASEVLTGIVFFITSLVLFSSAISLGQEFLLSTLAYFLLISLLLIVFLVDSKYGIIPLGAILVGLLVTLILFLLQPDFSPIPHLLSAIGAFLFLYILTLVRIKGKTAMGLGDAVYAFFMGFLLGFPGIIVGMYIAFLTGALAASILIVRGKKRLQGSTIPFGPFLVLGTYIALFWSNQIVWYALHFFYR